MFSPRETERTNSPSASPTDDGTRFGEARNDVIALSEARLMGSGQKRLFVGQSSFTNTRFKTNQCLVAAIVGDLLVFADLRSNF